jgi:hypothetical protein
MAALGMPSFQTKSNRSLFADVTVAPITTSADAEEIDSSNNNKIASTPVSSLTPKSKSPKKRSPWKSPKKKSPKNNDGETVSFFTRLYYSIAGYNSNGIYRAPPVAKGVYFDCRTNDVPLNSVQTIDTAHTSDDSDIFHGADWIASNLENHQRGVPIVVRRPEYDEYNETDDKKLLHMVMAKAKKLPQEPGKYASNHIMVNAERAKRNMPPLRRERHMDQIAREQAKLMASEKQLFHIDSPSHLMKRLKEKDKESNELPAFQRVAMNIGSGKDIAEAHRFMMAALAERNNIQDKRFCAIGMGTYVADNGMLYMCQVFGGR